MSVTRVAGELKEAADNQQASNLTVVGPAERDTDELVIAMVGPIGSGSSTCAGIIRDQLLREYGYTSGVIVKLSDVIADNAKSVGLEYDRSDASNRVENLQKIGSELRQRYGATTVVDLAMAEISSSRPKLPVGANADGGVPPATARRHFTIIDSIKNPEEYERLKSVYKDMLWMVGVFAPEGVRRRRLEGVFSKAEDAIRAMRVDQDEGVDSGQRVSDAMELADYFIRNDTFSSNRPELAVERFLDIVFGTKIITPTVDESSMYSAASAGAGSACLSRQVGAVIVNEHGEVIGTGTNDVPKFGGGLYSSSSAEDNRCHSFGGICYNDKKKDELSRETASQLSKAKFIISGKVKDVEHKIRSSRVKGLIEFSRAVHAEMEAIISVARSGASGIVGSTLYSTTYPCHNCARHIVAAGVSKVVYVEAYPKSLATELHHDAISVEESSAGRKVVFVQYEGTSPKNMLKLFYNRGNRKVGGKLDLPSRLRASPARAEPLDDFGARENMAVGSLVRLAGGEPARAADGE